MVVLLLCGAVPGSTPEKAEKFRVVSYLVVSSPETLDTLDTSHFRDLTDAILFGLLAGMNVHREVVLCGGFGGIVERIKAV